MTINADSNANVTLCSPRRSFENTLGPQTKKALLIASPKLSIIPPNHVLIRVEKFGFSANNITYEVLGEHPHFRYFDFHPLPDKDYGTIPVWGFGTILRSTVTHGKFTIKEGEKVYGYFAPTRYLLLPVEVNSVGNYAFYVARPHFPPDRRPYHQIIRCDKDPQYTATPEAEDLTMIYRPLFWTAYWCEDWLNSSGYRGGVSSVVISSASAKTAFCLAYLIAKRVNRGEAKQMRVLGLTSRRNMGFTQGLGLYDEVIEYGEIGGYFGSKCAEEKWLYIDVAGNEELNAEIESYLGQRLKAVVQLGVTTLSPRSPATSKIKDLGKETFFMPEWLDVRRSQLPVQEIIQRQNKAWAEMMQDCKLWIELERVHGADKVMLAYERVIREGFTPTVGHVWSMWDDPAAVRARL